MGMFVLTMAMKLFYFKSTYICSINACMKVFLRANVSLNSNPKQSMIKQLKSDIVQAVTQVVRETIFPGVRACLPSNIEAIFFENSCNKSAMKPDSSTSGATANTLFTEWGVIRDSANILCVEETISPPELIAENQATQNDLCHSLPPIVSSTPKGGLLASIKSIFTAKIRTNTKTNKGNCDLLKPGQYEMHDAVRDMEF